MSKMINSDWYDQLKVLDFIYNPIANGEAWYKADDVWACIEAEDKREAEHIKPVSARDYEAEYRKLLEKHECLYHDMSVREEKMRCLEVELMKYKTIIKTIEFVLGRELQCG